MRFSLSPIGIFLGQTLPALLLFILYGGIHALIAPVLDTDAERLWRMYAILFAVATLLATGYAIRALVKQQPVHALYGFLAFTLFVPLLWSFMDDTATLFPPEVSRFMVDLDAQLYAIRLLAITLLHALFVLVGASLSKHRDKAGRDLVIGILIPLAVYIAYQLVRPYQGRWDIEYHVWVTVMILLVIVFLFHVFRAVASVIAKKSNGSEAGLLVRACVGIALPVLGLQANTFLFGGVGKDVFGDLGHWSFFAVAILNGIVVLWGESPDPRTRMVQFLLRSIGFSYVLYFFILFAPFLPLSIIAIVAFGLGFLLLAPVLLFLVQGLQLVHDLRFLRDRWPLSILLGAFVLCILLIPAVITGVFLKQRFALHAALDHVYGTAAHVQARPVDPGNLRSVLDKVGANKERNGWAKEHTPFITPWFNYVVLDNLMISDAKLKTVDRIYFGERSETPPPATWQDPNPPTPVVLDRISARPQYDAGQQAWRTWVDFQVTNPGSRPQEFRTTFNLPAGAWISDQYLVIEGEPVKGVLAERKAATWIYQQIRSLQRDPSLTRYIAPGVIELRIFPVGGHETRHAGVEVLHKEPFLLTVGQYGTQLGIPGETAPIHAIISPDGAVVFVPAVAKRQLPPVYRKPHVHLIADASVASNGRRAAILEDMERFIVEQHVDPHAVTLHITDASTQEFPWTEEGRAAYLNHPEQGGFFSDRPIRGILSQACRHPSSERPVIVIVPAPYPEPRMMTGIWLDDLADLSLCLPESPTFHLLRGTTCTTRSFRSPHLALSGPVVPTDPLPVLAWPDAHKPQAYLSTNETTEIALLGSGTLHSAPLRERTWSDALQLEGQWRDLLVHPEKGTPGWMSLVQSSFQAQVLSPATAWICLENGAQLNALMKKQQDVLKASSHLDAAEAEPTPMSEPALYCLLVPMLLFLAWRRWR